MEHLKACETRWVIAGHSNSILAISSSVIFKTIFFWSSLVRWIMRLSASCVSEFHFVSRDILCEFASAGDLPLQSTNTPTIKPQRGDVDTNAVTSTGDSTMSNIPQILALPTHSNELGRMPIYQHFHADSESLLDPELFADAMSMQPPFQPLLDPSILGPLTGDTVFMSRIEPLACSVPLITTTAQHVTQYPDSFDQTSYSQILANFDFSAVNADERPRADELHSTSNMGYSQSYDTSSMDTDAMSIWENTPAGQE